MAAYEQEFDETNLAALVAHEIRQALDWDQSELSAKRSRALEYLRGEVNDVQQRPNGSSVTSRDLADTVSWMLPGIMRVFMASDRMAEYEPVLNGSPNDQMAIKQSEESAEQASDYVSYVFYKDNDGYRIVYNGTHDALATGDGVVKTWWDDKPETETSMHSGLTLEQVAELLDDEDVEILTQEENKEPAIVQDPMTGEPMQVPTFNVKIKRTTSHGRLRFDSVEPENFLIDEAAVTIAEARFTCHRDPYVTRSDLIEMGFKREDVDELSADINFLDSEESFSRHQDSSLIDNSMMRSTQRIDLYECFLRVDVDNDGVAETIKIYYAGDAGAGKVLDWEVWDDEVPFDNIPCYPQPHRYESESVADRMMDIQKIKTILQRQMLDNLYVSQLPLQEVEQDSVLNPDILVNPKFGGIIWKKRGSVPIVRHEVPFVADKTMGVTEYFDRIGEKRTGVSRTMMALDPEVLQNQSATANQNAKDASYSQVELVARHQAELGWRKVFRKALRLIVKHQDRKRTIRLRDTFVEMDPRHWNASMDVTVNVGLGTGSRDRDMAMLQNVLQMQVAITDRLAGVGFDREALEMLPRMRRSAIKIAESAGLHNPDQFFPEITAEEVQRMAQVAAEKRAQPPIEMQIEQMKVQAQAQLQTSLKEMDIQFQQLVESMKAEGNKVKEAAQLEADMMTGEQERQTNLLLEQERSSVKREQIASTHQLGNRKLDLEYQTREPVKVANEGLMDAFKQLGEAVNQLREASDHMASPAELVRDAEGRVSGVRRNGKTQEVRRGPDGEIVGLQ